MLFISKSSGKMVHIMLLLLLLLLSLLVVTTQAYLSPMNCKNQGGKQTLSTSTSTCNVSYRQVDTALNSYSTDDQEDMDITTTHEKKELCAAPNDQKMQELQPSSSTTATTTTTSPTSRRQAFSVGGSLMTLSALSLSSSSSPVAVKPAMAFDRTFPDELTELDGEKKVITSVTVGSRTNSQQRASVAAATKEMRQQNLVSFNMKDDFVPSVVWGAALWLLLGSRSNPLVTPLSNVLYDETKEQWLKDRNAGLFAAPPLPVMIILGIVFLSLGVLVQFGVLQLAEGDTGLCLQLAGVSLMSGGFLELGRIASGEKRDTREDFDRQVQLTEEFNAFAEKRLLPGGNCHRSDVVAAFRRFYAKYRRADNDEYPLEDLEIEKLLRSWNRIENRNGAEMTSSGFYYGIQINKQADVFA